MHPPMSDLGLMALFLAITAVISVAVGYGAYRLGWINHSPQHQLGGAGRLCAGQPPDLSSTCGSRPG